jgi:hypothetical protein
MRKTLRSILVLALVLGSYLATPLVARAADSKDVESSPQAKAYRESVKAIAAGDEKAYARTMTSEANKQMETKAKEIGKTPKELMELLKIMQPSDVKLSDLKVDGKNATMAATGKSAGETMYGNIELEDENGQWKVRKQRWSNTKK